ncbi:hypothetical protein [Sandaracinobacter sp.]|uniref:hypothetical protein n=1 Tax=Sandaracinobacter sp. TaxID=2487581 RepID=UPI0035B08D79
MLRALVVGFILGFALVGVVRLSGMGDSGAQLASTSGLRPGAAINQVEIAGRKPPRWLRSCRTLF